MTCWFSVWLLVNRCCVVLLLVLLFSLHYGVCFGEPHSGLGLMILFELCLAVLWSLCFFKNVFLYVAVQVPRVLSDWVLNILTHEDLCFNVRHQHVVPLMRFSEHEHTDTGDKSQVSEGVSPGKRQKILVRISEKYWSLISGVQR